MQGFVGWLEALLLNPITALALALVFVVIGWKYDVTASRYFLVSAWVLATFAVFRTVRGHLVVERLLWTMLVSSIVGLLLVQLDRHTTLSGVARIRTVGEAPTSQPIATNALPPIPARPTPEEGPAGRSAGATIAPAPAQVRATTGNLRERTLLLANEIMDPLYRHGWRDHPSRLTDMPTDGAAVVEWTRVRSNFFMFRHCERVRELRDEFASLHIRDQRLDDLIRRVDSSREGHAANPDLRSPLLPQEIEGAAETLRSMAAQLQ